MYIIVNVLPYNFTQKCNSALGSNSALASSNGIFINAQVSTINLGNATRKKFGERFVRKGIVLACYSMVHCTIWDIALIKFKIARCEK